MEIRWIKLASDIFDNRKIKQIETLPEGDAIIVIWFKLLCLAGNINDSGLVYFTKDIPYTDAMLAAQFGRPLTTIQLALQTFERFGMINTVDNVMLISNWEKYQNVEKMTDIREYNRIAQQRHRARIAAAPVNDNVNDDVNDKSMTSQPCQGTEEEQELEQNKERDYYNNNNNKQSFYRDAQAHARETDKKEAGKELIPPFPDVLRYFSDRIDNEAQALSQAMKFDDFNCGREWDCLPDWKTAADSWISRIREEV